MKVEAYFSRLDVGVTSSMQLSSMQAIYFDALVGNTNVCLSKAPSCSKPSVNDTIACEVSYIDGDQHILQNVFTDVVIYKTNTLKYDSGAFDTQGSMNSQEVCWEASDTFCDCDYSRPGYVFKGWSQSKGSTYTLYKAGDVIPSSLFAYDEEITMYAQWGTEYEITQQPLFENNYTMKATTDAQVEQQYQWYRYEDTPDAVFGTDKVVLSGADAGTDSEPRFSGEEGTATITLDKPAFYSIWISYVREEALIYVDNVLKSSHIGGNWTTVQGAGYGIQGYLTAGEHTIRIERVKKIDETATVKLSQIIIRGFKELDGQTSPSLDITDDAVAQAVANNDDIVCGVQYKKNNTIQDFLLSHTVNIQQIGDYTITVMLDGKPYECDSVKLCRAKWNADGNTSYSDVAEFNKQETGTYVAENVVDCGYLYYININGVNVCQTNLSNSNSLTVELSQMEYSVETEDYQGQSLDLKGNSISVEDANIVSKDGNKIIYFKDDPGYLKISTVSPKSQFIGWYQKGKFGQDICKVTDILENQQQYR